jgi:capsular exopolysaccharide synthesis family protein
MVHPRPKNRFRREEPANDYFLGRLVTFTSPDHAASEAYRNLRTNLLRAQVDDPSKVIMVTSPGPKEGKSTICANLGVVLAQADKNTLVLDCDLRKPTIHKMFGLRNLWGLVNLLTGERKLKEVWRESPLTKLKIVTTGPILPDPAALLYDGSFAQLLDQLRREFDFVLLDCPPTQLVDDPIVLAPQADGVLLVIDSQNTHKETVRDSIRSLEAVGANVLGTVLNTVEDPTWGRLLRLQIRKE